MQIFFDVFLKQKGRTGENDVTRLKMPPDVAESADIVAGDDEKWDEWCTAQASGLTGVRMIHGPDMTDNYVVIPMDNVLFIQIVRE